MAGTYDRPGTMPLLNDNFRQSRSDPVATPRTASGSLAAFGPVLCLTLWPIAVAIYLVTLVSERNADLEPHKQTVTDVTGVRKYEFMFRWTRVDEFCRNSRCISAFPRRDRAQSSTRNGHGSDAMRFGDRRVELAGDAANRDQKPHERHDAHALEAL
jgi:hypothetical protein